MQLLLIENNPAHAAEVIDALATRDFQVEQCATGAQALRAAVARRFDLILVASNIEGMSAVQFCRRLRASGIGAAVVALTDDADPVQRLELLDAGADDFLPKPCNMAELLARVRAVLRRCGVTLHRLCVGSIIIDPQSRIVTVDGQSVEVTEREGALLTYLAERAGSVVSRHDISRNVWKTEHTPASNTIDVNIRHLRSKLGEAARHLKTVRGAGYVLEA